MKKILLIAVFLSAFSAQAFTELEWTGFIGETLIVKDDMSWSYDLKKLKEHQNRIKKNDIPLLKNIAKSDDVQMSQGAKYLLATQGDDLNLFLLNNYLNDANIKNGLYYFHLNFVNTVEKNNLWKLVRDKEVFNTSAIKEEFKECSSFKDYHSQGGKDFTFDNYDDFYNQRNVVGNYTNADLFNLELDLSGVDYPVTVTFYNNRYIVQKTNDDKCLKTGDSSSYIEMQKIMALYKQYQRIDYLKNVCDDFENNTLLKSRFNYFCIDVEKSILK